MAGEMVARGIFFAFLLSLHPACSSGTLVGFSYDARGEKLASWSPRETMSVLEKNKVSSSQFRVFVANTGAYLDSLSNTGVPVDLFVNQLGANKLMKSRSLATSWIKTHLISFLPRINISSIVVTSSKQHHSLLPTLNSIQSALRNFNLDRSMKISTMFSLSTLEMLNKSRGKYLHGVMEFVKETESFIVVEAIVDGQLSLGDGFIDSVVQRAISACTVLPYADTPIVLNVKSSVAPSGVEIAEFTGKVLKSIDSYPQIKNRISGLFAEISPVRKSEQERLSWEEELIFPSSHRVLDEKNNPVSAAKTTVHDTIPPLTNPATTPITIPSTNPSPGIVTIPPTSPVAILPTNPTTTPITVPSTNPASTPITVPPTNPMPTTPVTNPTTPVIMPPVLPITNPAMAPPAIPLNPPVTNPINTYPIAPPGGIPLISPPATMPGTVPVSPTISGQSWCVAKTGITDAALQVALDYACGIGGADCSTIQPTGSCYNPNTLQAHASYAFNSYYLKNPVPTSCDFGGTATIVTVNPSSATCIYPSSSSSSSFNPASSVGPVPGSTSSGSGSVPTVSGSGPTVSGSGPTVLNANNSAGSSTVFGSDSPTGTMSSSSHLSAGWTFLSFVSMTIYITGKNW